MNTIFGGTSLSNYCITAAIALFALASFVGAYLQLFRYEWFATIIGRKKKKYGDRIEGSDKIIGHVILWSLVMAGILFVTSLILLHWGM
jgi:hypothetical protein